MKSECKLGVLEFELYGLIFVPVGRKMFVVPALARQDFLLPLKGRNHLAVVVFVAGCDGGPGDQTK